MIQAASAQIGYWDRVANEKRFSHPLRLNWLARYSTEEARILDYGCGYGRTLAELSHAGFQNLVGVDFSAAMLARARAAAPRSALIRNDGQSLPFKDDCIDAVLLFAVLTCIPGDADQRALIAELTRLLRPGGLLYVSDYPLQSDARNVTRYEAGRSRHGTYGVWDRQDGGRFRHHEMAWLRELLAGFEDLACEEVESVTMGGNPARVVQMLVRRRAAMITVKAGA
jgi:SAM-dependent methyltransferase